MARARALVSSLIASCPPPEPVSGRVAIPSPLFRAIPQAPVLEFISAFAIHPANIEMQQGPLLEYIRSRRFSEWDVVVISNSSAPPAEQIEIDGMRIEIGVIAGTDRLGMGADEIAGRQPVGEVAGVLAYAKTARRAAQ